MIGMRRAIRIAIRVMRIVVGVLCVLLGLVALFTPLTPGSWLIPIGLELLGLRLLLANKLRVWIEARPHSKVARILRWCLCVRVRDLVWKKRKGKGSGANSVVPPAAGNLPCGAPSADARHTDELSGRLDPRQRPY